MTDLQRFLLSIVARFHRVPTLPEHLVGVPCAARHGGNEWNDAATEWIWRGSSKCPACGAAV